MCGELDKFKSINQINPLELVNLGTGMGYYDFCYSGIPLSAFNFALPQQNLYFDYQLLKKYSCLFKKNCTVCLVLPYCIFCADRLEEALQRYERYYELLPPEAVEPYCSVSYESWLAKDKRETNPMDSLTYALSYEEMRYQSEEAIENWKRQLHIISFDTGEVSPGTKGEIEKSQYWLRNILRYCEKKNFRPVVVVPPMSQTLLDKISMKFRKLNFYDILYSTVPEKVEILDYSENSRFCHPQLYGWPGFLTEQAAREFTRDIVEKTGMG